MVLQQYYIEEQKRAEETRRIEEEARAKNRTSLNWAKGVTGVLTLNPKIVKASLKGDTDFFLAQSADMSDAEMVVGIATLAMAEVGARATKGRSAREGDITPQQLRQRASDEGIVLNRDVERELESFTRQYNEQTPVQRNETIRDYSLQLRNRADENYTRLSREARQYRADQRVPPDLIERIQKAKADVEKYGSQFSESKQRINELVDARADPQRVADEVIPTESKPKNKIDELVEGQADIQDIFAEVFREENEPLLSKRTADITDINQYNNTVRTEHPELPTYNEVDNYNQFTDRYKRTPANYGEFMRFIRLRDNGILTRAKTSQQDKDKEEQKRFLEEKSTDSTKPVGEVVGEEVSKTAGKIAGAQTAAAQVGVTLEGDGTQVAGETALDIAAGTGVPYATEVAAVRDAVKAVQTAETVAGIETLAGAGTAAAVAGGAAAGGAEAVGLYEILANEFSTPVEHKHIDKLHEIARTHHSSVSGYIEGDTVASVLSRDHITELVHDSQRVYDTDVLSQEGSVQVFEDASTDFRAVLYAHRNHDVLAFRGTDSLTNVITDLKFVSSKLSAYFDGVSGDFDLQCHQGFLDMLRTQYDAITEALSTRMDRPLRVTGHSMGAGLACVFSYLYAIKNKSATQPTETITFGSPRVFITGSRMVYNMVVENCFTVITDRDPVPQLPPVALGFEHIGRVITLFENAGILFRPLQKADDRRLRSAGVNVAKYNYYAGFADVEYRATMKALTADQKTFQYCKNTVLEEFNTHRESIPDETYKEIQNASMPDKSVFAQVVNGNVNLQYNRPSTYFIQGLENSAHTLTCYERRVQKLPQQLLDVEVEDEPEEEGDMAVEDDDDGFRSVPEFNGAEPAHTESMHSDHHSKPTVDYHEQVARQRKQPVEQVDPFHSRLKEHVNDPNSYVLGYVVYPESQADMYENAVVGFV